MLTRHTSKVPVKFPHGLGQRRNFPISILRNVLIYRKRWGRTRAFQRADRLIQQTVASPHAIMCSAISGAASRAGYQMSLNLRLHVAHTALICPASCVAKPRYHHDGIAKPFSGAVRCAAVEGAKGKK